MNLILITDRMPPARDNIGTYTCHLAASLRRQGRGVEVWSMRSPCDCSLPVSCSSFARFRFNRTYRCAWALRRQSDAVVLWQYNPFLYGWKGLPSLFYLLPLLAKVLSTCRVAIVFHEIHYDYKREPRSWVWATSHRVALWLALLGADVAIATTGPREARLRRFVGRFLPWRAGRLRYATVPVGSNVPIRPWSTRRDTPEGLLRVGLFRTSMPRPDVVLMHEVCGQLGRAGVPNQLVLIGGAPAGLGRHYDRDDHEPGTVETGYLPAGEVSDILHSLDVFVNWYREGASGRRTSLAAALAHGLCVVSSDSSESDHALFRGGENCVLTPYGDATGLQDTLRRVGEDRALREHTGRRARATYQQELAWPVIADKIVRAVS